MRDATSSFRSTAAICLVANAVLSTVSVVLQPTLGSGSGSRLASIDAARSAGAVSAVAFVVSQLPFILGVLGVAWLLWDRSPRLARVGGTLGVLGGFGHAVFGGISLTEIVMASDRAHRAVLGGLDRTLESSPVMIFALLGTAGTVLGLLLLSVGLFRSRVVPVSVPVLVWAFLVLEFAGSGVSRYASYVAAVLLVIAFVTLARVLWPSTVVAVDGAPSRVDATA
jgi:hypothetical protein